MTACPPTETLQELLLGDLPSDDAAMLRDHVEACPSCLESLDRLSDDPELELWLAEGQSDDRSGLAQRAALFGPRSSGAPGTCRPRDVAGLTALGPYDIEAEVGRGGMGVVYRARDRTIGRIVALKVLHPDLADDRARRRFVREVRAAARVEHDHVVRVYATSHPSEPVLYFAMEYLGGPSLAARIRAAGALDPREAARAVAEAAAGLAAAHAAGLVHRDVKPDNILIDPVTGRAKVGDFGLARLAADPSDLTRDGVAAGTPAYFSPEQARGDPDPGPSADVYALGVSLYECLTGEVPYRGAPHRVVQRILHDEPRPPRALNDEVPRDLEAVCLKAMAKEPHRRYASADDLAADLGRWLRGEPVRARRVGPAGRLWRLARRRPLPAALLASLAAVLLSGTVALLALWRRAEASADRARASLADAERSYRQAREAVDRFYTKMIVDQTLDKPGLEFVRAEVVRSIVDYYREFLKQRGDDPELRADAAEASLRVGLMTQSQGDKRDALAALAQARGLLEALARDRPRDAKVRLELGKCLDVTGCLLVETGRANESIEVHRACFGVYRALVASEPDNPSSRQLLGVGLGNLANAYAISGRQSEALATYRLAREQQDILVRLEPKSASYRNDLGMTLNNLSMVLDDPKEKLELVSEALAIRRALSDERPDHTYLKRNVARALHNQGVVNEKLERYADALPLFDEACAKLRTIVRDNPVTTFYRRELAESISGRAAALLGLDRASEAIAAAGEGFELLNALAQVDPENGHVRLTFNDLYRVAALSNEKLGRLDEALRLRQARLILLQRLVRDHPDRLELREALEAEPKAIDDLNARLGQTPDAKPDRPDSR